MSRRTSKHLNFQELQRLEPLVRKLDGSATEAQQAEEASKLLGRQVTAVQIGGFRQRLGLVKHTRHQWALKRTELQRLDLMLQTHGQVVVFRGPKRMYLMPFDKATAMRDRFIKNRIWEKGPNGKPAEARLAHASPASS